MVKQSFDQFADTEPFIESNEVDKLGEKAGLDMSPEEELGLKDKLEERDKERLDLKSKAVNNEAVQ